MMTARPTKPRKAAKRKSAGSVKTKRRAGKKNVKRWSAKVAQESDALDLKQGVFTLSDPKKIAASLKRSAEESHRRKAEPYRSALSMLVFYINRGGKNLSAAHRKKLDQAKDELKKLFGRAN